MRPVYAFAAALIAATLGAPVPATSHDVNHQGRAPAAADPSRIPVVVVDRPVVDHDGVPHGFAELVGKRLMVVNFIYTTCGTLCPLQSAVLATLQDELGAKLGRDVEILSLTVDPVTDQVPQLKEQAVRFGAKPGWSFLGGKPKDIEVILTGMQAWVETPEDHPGFYLIGAADQKQWIKLDGMASPDELLHKIAAMEHDRGRAR